MSWDVLSSVLGGVGSLVGAGADLYNVGQQKKQFEWQKMAQEKTWAREDNAVQRRVEDLKAAGLSPTLAAGSAAAASSPITPKAPQASMQNMMNGLAISNMVENIAKTQAEKKRIEQEINIVKHDFDKIKDTPMFYFNHHQDWTAVLASAIDKMLANFKLPFGKGENGGGESVTPNISLGAISDEEMKKSVISQPNFTGDPNNNKLSPIQQIVFDDYMNRGKVDFNKLNNRKMLNINEFKMEYDQWTKDNPGGKEEDFFKYLDGKYGKFR